MTDAPLIATERKIKGQPVVALAAGGTGGHLFPAQALAEDLGQRGFTVHLLTDERGLRFCDGFPQGQVHPITASTLEIRKPWRLPWQSCRIASGYLQARRLLKKLRPVVVAGFGGYPSLPPLLAAHHMGLPVLIHEQNAVMGRANRFLAARAAHIALSFPPGSAFGLSGTQRLQIRDRISITGNPVRRQVAHLAGAAYEPPAPSGPITLVIFGGSQGSLFFSRQLARALTMLKAGLRRRLRIVQQCRQDDSAPLRALYDRRTITAELAPFFPDIPQRMAIAQLVISRSGASTIAELCVIGRPAILFPLPGARDNDQLHNARAFCEGGGGWLFEESAFHPGQFAAFLEKLLSGPDDLTKAAHAAGTMGGAKAAHSLAQALVRLIPGAGNQGADRKP